VQLAGRRKEGREMCVVKWVLRVDATDYRELDSR